MHKKSKVKNIWKFKTYNPAKEMKSMIAFDNMIADMEAKSLDMETKS